MVSRLQTSTISDIHMVQMLQTDAIDSIAVANLDNRLFGVEVAKLDHPWGIIASRYYSILTLGRY